MCASGATVYYVSMCVMCAGGATVYYVSMCVMCASGAVQVVPQCTKLACVCYVCNVVPQYIGLLLLLHIA
jgi:hypothetical protein